MCQTGPSPPTEGLWQLPQLCAPKASGAPRTRQCAAPSAQSACRSSRRSCLPPRPPAAAECGRRVLEYSKVPADAEGLGVLSPVVEYRRRPRRRPGYMFVCLRSGHVPVSWQRSAAAEGRRSKCRAQAHRCVCQVHVVRQVYVCVPNARRATGVGCMPRRFRSCSMSDWSSACRSASRRRACAISHHGCRDAVQPRAATQRAQRSPAPAGSRAPPLRPRASSRAASRAPRAAGRRTQRGRTAGVAAAQWPTSAGYRPASAVPMSLSRVKLRLSVQ